MNKPYPAFCKDCKYSTTDKDAEWNLRCGNPIVNANDEWALAGSEPSHGSACREQRRLK